uniref:H/ACA ribonucleoprotein complex non-core subunit NAF1 n=1 Tax=Panagrolaimus superbus TaxID=310955 RepID=A0A914Z4L4_9BILA
MDSELDSNVNKPDEDLYIVDTEGNEYIAMPEKAAPQPFPSCNRWLKGDPKIAAKYQWRQGKQFCDGNEAEPSSESEDEDFNKILQTNYVDNDEGEVVKKPKEFKKAMDNTLDKEYYDLPNFEALSLTCLESCVIEPFGKVFQHYDALVMIKAYPNKPYLDMDTMLFTSEKIPAGRIYELMGMVEDPLYNLLFASVKETTKLPVGTELFYAPSADESVTKFLYLEDLRNNSKWQTTDEGLGESDDEVDEETQYYDKLKKQLEEYEQRKRGRSESVSSSTVSKQFGPSQPKQRRGNNFTPRPQNFNQNRHSGNVRAWRGQHSSPYNPNQQVNPFALPPPQPSYYVPHGLFNYPPPRSSTPYPPPPP